MSRRCSLQELAAAIPSGSLVAIGGFQLNRVPTALLSALVEAGVGDLRVVSAPNPLALDLLVAQRRVCAAEGGFFGFQFEDGFVIAPAVRRALQEGRLDYVERDVYETILALRAAAAGGDGGPDIALLHVQAADEEGNLRIDDPHADLLLAAASRRIVATAEHIVPRLREPQIDGDRVEAFAACPGGAAPAACAGHYGRDPEAIRAYLAAAPPDMLRIVADSRERRAAGATQDAGAPGQPVEAPRRDAQPPAGPRQAMRVVRGAESGTSEARSHARSGRPDLRASQERLDPAAAAAADLFVAAMARQVHDRETVVTGLASALAMLAIELARRTHAPRLRYINCVGAVDPRLPRALPVSVEAELLGACAATITLPEIFDLARDGGVDTMFFGAAQIDGGGAINLTRIGPAGAPAVKLPGPAGSPSMRGFIRRAVIAVPRQSRRTLVAEVDVPTSVPAPGQETVLVTDLAVWELEEGALIPRTLHPGINAARLAAATGFGYSAARAGITEPVGDRELAALRALDPDGLRYRLLGLAPTAAPRQETIASARSFETATERILR